MRGNRPLAITIRTLALTLALQLPAVSVHAGKPETLPPGMGLYVMVLWDAGTPIPAPGSPGLIRRVDEPNVAALGGRLIHKVDNRRIIALPLGAAKQLWKHEAVVYLQRLWNGESLEGWDEGYPVSSNALTPKTDADTNLTWGPKAYAYDGSGNIKQIGSGESYIYDTAGRLIQATVNGKTESYKYDAFGNLTEKAVAGANAVPIRWMERAIASSDRRMMLRETSSPTGKRGRISSTR